MHLVENAASETTTGIVSEAELAIRCREFALGREDWNRGQRCLSCSYIASGVARYRADGTLVIDGFPLGDLLLEAADVSRALADGLQFQAPDFEAEVTADSLRHALLPAIDVTPQFVVSR